LASSSATTSSSYLATATFCIAITESRWIFKCTLTYLFFYFIFMSLCISQTEECNRLQFKKKKKTYNDHKGLQLLWDFWRCENVKFSCTKISSGCTYVSFIMNTLSKCTANSLLKGSVYRIGN